MNRDIRFAARAILNPAQYESLEFVLDETIHVPNDADVGKHREQLISKVTSRMEKVVLEARQDIAAAKRKARRENGRR